ncbi:MAG: hypothetical protein E5Y52_05895 [Mesorhizobium sp.]|nr:MAG: hypothetical protein E5Y52_05895 [Mesorhizobium sp.]TIR70632.1 MAG: hypothetical protein E5X24_08330 [Mesorhizobium sp.]
MPTETDDHSACETAQVELGVRFLDDTPHHVRGAAVPALKRLGLTSKEACEAVRLHNIKLAGGADAPS